MSFFFSKSHRTPRGPEHPVHFIVRECTPIPFVPSGQRRRFAGSVLEVQHQPSVKQYETCARRQPLNSARIRAASTSKSLYRSSTDQRACPVWHITYLQIVLAALKFKADCTMSVDQREVHAQDNMNINVLKPCTSRCYTFTAAENP